MLNNKLLLAVGAVTLSTSFFSGTLTAADVIGNTASANVLTPITLAAGANALDFGDIVPDTVATSDLLLDAATGVITVTGSATTSGTPTSADFTVGGDDVAFFITLPADSTVTLTGGGAPMPVDSFTSDQPGNVGTISGGTAAIKVGATLTVGISQALGPYTGLYDVTVNYQ